MSDYKKELRRVYNALPVLDVRDLYIFHAKLRFKNILILSISSESPFTNEIEFEKQYKYEHDEFPHFLWEIKLCESGLAYIDLAGGMSYSVRYPVSLLARMNQHNCMNGRLWESELQKLIEVERYG